jgi:hypothetical protein
MRKMDSFILARLFEGCGEYNHNECSKVKESVPQGPGGTLYLLLRRHSRVCEAKKRESLGAPKVLKWPWRRRGCLIISGISLVLDWMVSCVDKNV